MGFNMRWFEKNIIAPLDGLVAKVEKFWDQGAVQKVIVLFGFFFFAIIFLSIVTKIFA